MHTLRQVEAGIQQQLVEHRLSLECKLDDAVRRSEESAFRRAEELLAPQTADLRRRLDAELPPLRPRLEEVLRTCQEENVALRTRFERDVEALSIEVAGIHASLPTMRGFLSEHAERLKVLEEVPVALRAELSELRAESRREISDVRRELENETRRAEGQEAANVRMMQERLDAGTALMRAVDERAREQSSTAMHNMGIIEKHLLFKVDDTRAFATNEAIKYAEDSNVRLRPELLEARDLMQQRLDECAERMSVRCHATEAQLRRELQAELGSMLEKCDRFADLKAAEVSMKLSEGLEDARRDLRSQAEKHHETSQRWRDEFQEAMTRLESVASAARLSCEQIQRHASQQLATASSQLRGEVEEVRRGIDKDIQSLRGDLDSKAVHIEMVERSDAAISSAEGANKRVGMLEVHYDRVKAWLEREATDLSDRCHSAQSEASDMKQRLHRENSALGDELSRVRAAATSLTHGVLRAFQVMGFLSELPQQTRDPSRTTLSANLRWGVDVEDLVEWERTGRSLADRVSEHWSSFAPAGASTMLELMVRKADHGEVKMVRNILSARDRNPQKQPRTPSTAAGFSDSSPLPGSAGGTEALISPFSTSPASPATLPAVVSNFNRTI